MFTVTNVSKSGYIYQSADNHDPDGTSRPNGSTGTAIVVNRP
jgi:hypothetical protein